MAYNQRRSELTARAKTLLKRGVRRVFAIFVKAGQVEEWSSEHKAFVLLDLKGRIEDPCLHTPIKVHALLDAAEADEAVARALVARRHHVIEEVRKEGYQKGLKEGREEGRKEGLVEGIEVCCVAFNIALTLERRRVLATANGNRLRSILQALASTQRWPEESSQST